MGLAAETRIWTSNGPRTLLEMEGKKTEVLVEEDTHLAYAHMIVREAPKQDVVELLLDDGTVITTGEDQMFYEKRDRVEVPASSLGQQQFTPHKIWGLRKNGLASVYRHKAGRGYRALSNGYRKVYEHHVGFPDRHSSESVHHLNENKTDNRPENLILVQTGAHCTDYHSGKDSLLYKHDLDTKEMQQLRTEGLTYKEIGLRLGCNLETVRRRLGLMKSQDFVDPTHGHYRSDIDVSQILSLREEGMSIVAIAKVLGCSHSTISLRLRVFKKTNHKILKLTPGNYQPQLYTGNLPNFFVFCEKGGVLVKGQPNVQ